MSSCSPLGASGSLRSGSPCLCDLTLDLNRGDNTMLNIYWIYFLTVHDDTHYFFYLLQGFYRFWQVFLQTCFCEQRVLIMPSPTPLPFLPFVSPLCFSVPPLFLTPIGSIWRVSRWGRHNVPPVVHSSRLSLDNWAAMSCHVNGLC